MSGTRLDVDALERERDTLSAIVADLREAIIRAERRFDLFTSTITGISWEVWGRPDEALSNYVSASAETMTGYSLDIWHGRPGFFCSIVHPDDRSRVLREIDASYDPFFTTKPPGEGTGASAPGDGATFTVRVPLAARTPARSNATGAGT